ncbi:hypothetical protein E4P40_25465 [Blastococcus sp. CT_GayMR20]|nr:hypothetical protein E4P40_25465 [Blastococcus sp. CT_GayMR20]
MSDEPRTLTERNGEVPAPGYIRLLANAQGVELADIQGTGVGGRISRNDVLARAAATRPRPATRLAASSSRSAGRYGNPRPEDVSSWAQGAEGASRLAAARARGGEPTLFAGSHLPRSRRRGSRRRRCWRCPGRRGTRWQRHLPPSPPTRSSTSSGSSAQRMRRPSLCTATAVTAGTASTPQRSRTGCSAGSRRSRCWPTSARSPPPRCRRAGGHSRRSGGTSSDERGD